MKEFYTVNVWCKRSGKIAHVDTIRAARRGHTIKLEIEIPAELDEIMSFVEAAPLSDSWDELTELERERIRTRDNGKPG